MRLAILLLIQKLDEHTLYVFTVPHVSILFLMIITNTIISNDLILLFKKKMHYFMSFK